MWIRLNGNVLRVRARLLHRLLMWINAHVKMICISFTVPGRLLCSSRVSVAYTHNAEFTYRANLLRHFSVVIFVCICNLHSAAQHTLVSDNNIVYIFHLFRTIFFLLTKLSPLTPGWLTFSIRHKHKMLNDFCFEEDQKKKNKKIARRNFLHPQWWMPGCRFDDYIKWFGGSSKKIVASRPLVKQRMQS